MSAKEKFLLVGYPSPALVGAFAVSFLIDDLKMEFVEGLEFSGISPNYFIHNGKLEGPIRVYQKGNIYATLSMMPLDLKLGNDFGKTIAEFAKKKSIDTLLVPRGLEIIAKKNLGTKKFAFSIGKNAREVLKKNNLETLPRATIFGADAGIVSALKKIGLDCVFLYTPSNTSLSDGKATIESIKTLAQILNIQINFDNVKETINKIKKKNQQLVQEAKKVMKKPESTHPYSIYR